MIRKILSIAYLVCTYALVPPALANLSGQAPSEGQPSDQGATPNEVQPPVGGQPHEGQPPRHPHRPHPHW